MVDVSGKAITKRTAVAQTVVRLPAAVMEQLKRSQPASAAASEELHSRKGPVFATSIVAGVLAAKKTSQLIPFCHPIAIEDCKIDIAEGPEANTLVVTCLVTTTGKTGVEMEALVGSSLAALTVYDMLKSLSHDLVIEQTRLLHKSGGKSDVNLHPPHQQPHPHTP